MTTMPAHTFAQQVERVFELGRDNITTDGFCLEMLTGYDAEGSITSTFAGSADMNRDRLAVMMPEGTRVIARPLLDAGTLLAAGLALSGAASAIYLGVVTLGEEQFLIASGVSPASVQAATVAIPLVLLDVDAAKVTSRTADSPLVPALLELENWLMSLIAETPTSESAGWDAILAS